MLLVPNSEFLWAHDCPLGEVPSLPIAPAATAMSAVCPTALMLDEPKDDTGNTWVHDVPLEEKPIFPKPPTAR